MPVPHPHQPGQTRRMIPRGRARRGGLRSRAAVWAWTASTASTAPAAPTTQAAVMSQSPGAAAADPYRNTSPRSERRNPNSVAATPTAMAAPSRTRAGPVRATPRARAHPADKRRYWAAWSGSDHSEPWPGPP